MKPVCLNIVICCKYTKFLFTTDSTGKVENHFNTSVQIPTSTHYDF